MGASAATPDAEKPATIPGNTEKDRKKGEKPADDAALPPEEVDLAVAELRYQTAFHLEACQAMIDGVVLGAEQAQDKRIEFLEKASEVDAGTMVFILALTFVLEGTIGPALAVVAVRSFFRPMLRSTALAIRLSERQTALKDLRLFRMRHRSIQAAMSGQKGAEAFYPGNVFSMSPKEFMERCRRTAQEIAAKDRAFVKKVGALVLEVSLFVEANLVGAVKTPLAVQGLSIAGPAGAGDSPGVEVLSAAQTSAARLRLMVSAVHEALEAHIKHPQTKTSDVADVLEGYRVDGEMDLQALRDAFKLSTEAMIWARTLVPAGNDTASLESGMSSQLAGNAPLASYLFRRFEAEVERWALRTDAPTDREIYAYPMPSAPAPKPTGWWDSLPGREKQALLQRFLISVSSAVPELVIRSR